MRRPMIALAVLLLPVLGACTAAPAPEPLVGADPFVQTAEPYEPGPSTAVVEFGEPYTWTGGATMTVGEPVDTDVAPTDGRYLRVVAVEVAVMNGGTGTVPAAAYQFRAATDGPAVAAYTGPEFVPPSGPLEPGRTVTWTQFFQLGSREAAEFELEVVATTDEARPAVYFRTAI